MSRINLTDWHPSYAVYSHEEYRQIGANQWSRYDIYYYPDGSAMNKIIEQYITKKEYFKRKLAGKI